MPYGTERAGGPRVVGDLTPRRRTGEGEELRDALPVQRVAHRQVVGRADDAGDDVDTIVDQPVDDTGGLRAVVLIVADVDAQRVPGEQAVLAGVVEVLLEAVLDGRERRSRAPRQRHRRTDLDRAHDGLLRPSRIRATRGVDGPARRSGHGAGGGCCAVGRGHGRGTASDEDRAGRHRSLAAARRTPPATGSLPGRARADFDDSWTRSLTVLPDASVAQATPGDGQHRCPPAKLSAWMQ